MIGIVLLRIVVVIVTLGCFAPILVVPARAQTYTQTVTKRCGRCGNEVSATARVGDVCPHCGVRWGYENSSTTTRRVESPVYTPPRFVPAPTYNAPDDTDTEVEAVPAYRSFSHTFANRTERPISVSVRAGSRKQRIRLDPGAEKTVNFGDIRTDAWLRYVVNGETTSIGNWDGFTEFEDTATLPLTCLVDLRPIPLRNTEISNQNGRIAIVLRAFLERSGGSLQQDGERLVISWRGDIIHAAFNSARITKNGNTRTLTEPLRRSDGRLVVSIRVLCDLLGATVKFDGATNTVEISTL
jgi:DNA-directed RNA polymerase subunit RPC12/RpoP